MRIPVWNGVFERKQRRIAHADIETAEDIQEALKDLLRGTIKEMMEAEMDEHLGYEKSERSDNDDYRNGYKRKQVNSRYGSMEIQAPQERSVFPSDTALLKALYLATFEATKRWTTTIRDWTQVYGELSIMYEGRLPK